MLQNPSVKAWLGGVEPAWTLLDGASFAALSRPPSAKVGPIRLVSDLTAEEIQQSAVARNALILMRAAAAGPGLKTTATGNLSRSVVAEMYDRFTWPGFDKVNDFPFHKVINEPDFLPLFFLHHLAQAGKTLRKHKGHIMVTPPGRRMLEERNLGALQAVLFHIAFWHLDLGYLSRGLHHGWPQRDAGIVLWSLSIAANDWQPRERLTRLCTIPSMAYSRRLGILPPSQWRHRSSDPFNGLGSSNIGTRKPNRTASKCATSIGRAPCSTASFPSTSGSTKPAHYGTERTYTRPQ
jgi:hypothetical protein